MSVVRHYAPNVVPLELWDAVIEGVPLYRLPADQVPCAIATLVEQLRLGLAQRLRAGTRLPGLRVERVVLAGGGPLEAAKTQLCARGIHASIADDAAWIAERGGRALLQAFAPEAAGAVIDVGQTAIKYSDAAGRLRLERDLREVPLELDVRDCAEAATFRARTIAFIASALRQRSAPAALVLGLPCEIDADLTVAGCSYPWPAGDRNLVSDILRAAQLERIPCRVLNDAELAALSVSLLHKDDATLVLTLGLGLGAAYLP